MPRKKLVEEEVRENAENQVETLDEHDENALVDLNTGFQNTDTSVEASASDQFGWNVDESAERQGMDVLSADFLDSSSVEIPGDQKIPYGEAGESTAHDAQDDAGAGMPDHGNEDTANAAAGSEHVEGTARNVDLDQSGQSTGPAFSRDSPDDERRAFFGQDFRALDRSLTPKERQEWNSIYASYRGRSVMNGVIAGVDPVRLRTRDHVSGAMVWQEMLCAVVIPHRVRILIPETEMWQAGEERPRFVMRNISNASIDFVIIKVDRENGLAFGSRRMALPSRRYFFSIQPDMNRSGSRISCDVLAVGPRRCLVSCNGYDIDLTQRDLCYAAVADLREEYHSGDTLECIVKEYDHRRNHLVISVKETESNPFDGAEFRHPEGARRCATIAGKYAGGVFCNLSDGITIMCNYAFHYDDSAFRSGDRVLLIIQRYDMEKKQIYGKIVAKV